MKFSVAEMLGRVSPGRVYEDYSGRGMNGQTTVGFVTEDVGRLLSDVLTAVSTGELTQDDFAEVEGAIGIFRSDSLGSDVIIY